MIIHNEKNAELTQMGQFLYNEIKSSVAQKTRLEQFIDITKYEFLAYNINLNGKIVPIYSKAIQMALNENFAVYIPYIDHPVYLNESIILNSGNSLKVHPDTKIILIGDICMLRNRNIIDGHYNGVYPGFNSDHDINISGGIWELPDTVRLNYDPPRDYLGCDAGFLLHNIVNVKIEDMTIRNTNRMGLQLGNCRNFIVKNIKFENAGRDGIHIEGPAAYGVISNISGLLGDDVIALNAWDWSNGSLTFGAIHNVIVEDIICEPGYLWSEMRLHPGNKPLPDGDIIECPLYNILFNNIRGIHTIKLYNQPNLMPGQQKDRSLGLGCMYNIFFENITFDYFDSKKYYTVKNAGFEIDADIYNISFKNISFNYPLCNESFSNYNAIAVGPISATWKTTDNPKDWVDFFEADDICKVNKMVIDNVAVNGEPCKDVEKLILVRHLTINPDYPNTTPRGGTGYGVIRELFIT